MKTCFFVLIVTLSAVLICAPSSAQDSFPFKLTIKQRSFEKLAFFNDKISIGLGDISGGQVTVRVDDTVSTKSLHEPVSLKKYEKLSFEYRGRRIYVQVIELRNFLIGSDDNADILVSDAESDMVTPPTPTVGAPTPHP